MGYRSKGRTHGNELYSIVACRRLNANLLAVDNLSCYKVFGADYRIFFH